MQKYEKQQPSIAQKHEAVKWLGDAGPHELGKINRKSVNDGLRQISLALAQRYVFSEDDEAAREIIDKRGPRSST